MPIYQVKCTKCDKQFEEFAHIENRHNIKCKCDGDTKILIKSRKNIGIQIWKPYWEENITQQPVLVESKQHLKKLCDENDVHAVRLD